MLEKLTLYLQYPFVRYALIVGVLIAELNREGIAICMVSHDVTAVRYASHILHVGDAVFFGTRDAYLQSDVGKSYLTAQKGGAA